MSTLLVVGLTILILFAVLVAVGRPWRCGLLGMLGAIGAAGLAVALDTGNRPWAQSWIGAGLTFGPAGFGLGLFAGLIGTWVRRRRQPGRMSQWAAIGCLVGGVASLFVPGFVSWLSPGFGFDFTFWRLSFVPIPLPWLGGLAGAILGGLGSFVVGRRKPSPRVGFCPQCDYDLTGNVTRVCPECGTQIAASTSDEGGIGAPVSLSASGHYRIAFLALSLAIVVSYMVSFFLPVFDNTGAPRGGHMSIGPPQGVVTGSKAFGLGIMAMGMHPGWLANPLFAVGLLMFLLKRHRVAGVLACIALLFALSNLTYLLGNQVVQHRFQAGYYVWLTSMALLGGSGLMLSSWKLERGRLRSNLVTAGVTLTGILAVILSANLAVSSRVHTRYGPVTVDQVVRGLADKTPARRIEAARSVARIGGGETGKEVVSGLVEALNDSNALVRLEAVRALRQIGSGATEAAPALLQRLKDENPQVRGTAAAVLGALSTQSRPEEVQELMQLLRDPDRDMRHTALMALDRMASAVPEAVPLLIELLDDEHEINRGLAASVLGKIGPAAKAASPALIGALKDTDLTVRFNALQALKAVVLVSEVGESATGQGSRRRRGRGSRALPALTLVGEEKEELVASVVALLDDENKIVRSRAASFLMNIGPQAKAAIPALVKAIEDNDKGLLYAALAALVSIGPEPGVLVPVLVELMDNSDKRIRLSARLRLERSLSGMGPQDRDMIPVLIELLGRDDRNIRLGSLSALFSFGAEARSATPALINVLKDADERLRSSALGALQEIGAEGRELAPALLELIDERGRDGGKARWLLARFFATLGPNDRDWVPVLVKLLNHSDRRLQAGAATGLGAIGAEAKEAIPVLTTASQKADRGVRSAAVEALKKITASSGLSASSRPSTKPAN